MKFSENSSGIFRRVALGVPRGVSLLRESSGNFFSNSESFFISSERSEEVSLGTNSRVFIVIPPGVLSRISP